MASLRTNFMSMKSDNSRLKTPLTRMHAGSPAEASIVSDDDLLTRDDIQRETKGGITRRWLELAAHRGEGPPMLKISRRMVRYRRADFKAWLEAQLVSHHPEGK